MTHRQTVLYTVAVCLNITAAIKSPRKLSVLFMYKTEGYIYYLTLCFFSNSSASPVSLKQP